MARDAKNSTILGEALSAAQAAVVVTSPARVITAANAAVHVLLGYTPSALIGRQVRTLYAAGDDYAAVDSAIHDGAQAGTTIPVTLRELSGALIDADVIVLPVRDGAGKLTSIVKILTPAKAAVALRVPNPARDHGDLLRFARGAAHDFKNILAIITGNMDLAQDAKSESLRFKFFENAGRAGRDAVRVADQMISFARHQHVMPETINLSDILEELGPLGHYSGFNGANVVVHTQDNLPKIFVDRSGLRNALLNLIINARDAIAKNGHIAISASVVQAAFGAGDSPRTYVAITVRDTGTGMTEHVRKRAFDPFFSTKPASHGRGLGLATVSGFARQSEGYVTIDSKVGVGTEVTLFLPPA